MGREIKISNLEILQALSTEDRNRFLATLFNQNSTGKVLRVTGTHSNNAPPEEIRQTIEQMFDLPAGALKNWNPPLESFDDIRNDFLKVLDVIEQQKNIFLQNPKITSDKYEELEHAGKFIVAFGDQLQLTVQHKLLDFPDFILQHKGKSIGLEHTRLIEGIPNAVFKRIKSCLEETKIIMLRLLPGAEGNINLYLIPDAIVINQKSFQDLTITKAENLQAAKIIADYLVAEINGQSVPKPNFIQKAIIGTNPGILLNITFGQKYLPEKDSEAAAIIMSRIAAKEKRYISYISNCNFDELWLLMVMDGVKQSSGFKLNENVVPVKTQSKFDRLFVFDAFDSTIKEITTVKLS